MSRLAASFVLGYHGCDAAVARKAVNGESALLRSERDYDWLGPGAYFWESDPERALDWANAHRNVKQPAVVGAVIDLGNCLDLLNRQDTELVERSYKLFRREQRKAGLPMPVNKGLSARRREPPLRRLDCAVIRFLHQLIDANGGDPFDTVRGMFPEGRRLYPGAGFRARNHIQIAVCNPAAIKGLFYPPGMAPD